MQGLLILTEKSQTSEFIWHLLLRSRLVDLLPRHATLRPQFVFRTPGRWARAVWLLGLKRPGSSGLIGLIVVALLTAPGGILRADHLVLRDLNWLDNIRVTGFDEDGVRLEDGRQWTWDQIASGGVAPDQQAEFDAFQKRLSLPLYRLQWRLQLEDDSDLLTCTEPLLETYSDRKSLTAAMVWYGEFRGRLAQGQRAAAVQSLLKIDSILQSGNVNSAALATVLSRGDQRPWLDPESGVCTQMLPVWFNADEAKTQWEDVYNDYLAIQAPSPTATLYVAALATAADHAQVATQLLQKLEQPTSGQRQWSNLIRLEVERPEAGSQERMSQLTTDIQGYSRPLQVVGYYTLGRARLAMDQDSSIQKGQLELLRIPAVLKDVAEQVSGDAISQVAASLEANDHPREANILWNELKTNYPLSWHARPRTGQ